MSKNQKILRIFGILEIVSAIIGAIAAIRGAGAVTWGTVAFSLITGLALLQAAKDASKIMGAWLLVLVSLVLSAAEILFALNGSGDLVSSQREKTGKITSRYTKTVRTVRPDGFILSLWVFTAWIRSRHGSPLISVFRSPRRSPAPATRWMLPRRGSPVPDGRTRSPVPRRASASPPRGC